MRTVIDYSFEESVDYSTRVFRGPRNLDVLTALDSGSIVPDLHVAARDSIEKK
jgi:hypothetical protein